MANISIAIDAWKLTIYERHLTAAGFACQPGPGLIADDTEHISLRISGVTDMDALDAVLKDCLMDAAWPGGPHHDGAKK